MPGVSTIVICREDLSIPGGDPDAATDDSARLPPGERLFELLHDTRLDVVVLDLSVTAGRGIESVRRIRERTSVPVLVICDPHDKRMTDYRIAGAADCLTRPIDLMELNDTIQRIIRLTRPSAGARERIAARRPEPVLLADILFAPDQNTLTGADGTVARLTTAENDLLCRLVARPWQVCSRADIGSALYGERAPASDRAVDSVVNRLRKKFASVGATAVESLVKTEFRRGYMLACDVTAAPGARAAAPRRVQRDEGAHRDALTMHAARAGA